MNDMFLSEVSYQYRWTAKNGKGDLRELWETFHQFKERYDELAEHLSLFLSGWLGFDDWQKELALDEAVDLHILPVSILWSEFARTRIGKLHYDPRFLDNALSAVLRFDHRNNSFVPTTIEELREANLGKKHLSRSSGS